VDVLRESYQLRKTDLKKRNLVVASSTPAAIRTAIEQLGYRYPKPAEVWAFMMCKGGVGKTTSALFISQRLSSYGAKVLVIDADPQGNLTAAFHPQNLSGIEITEETPVLVDVLSGSCTLEEATIQLTPEMSLVPSTPMNSILDGKIRDLFKNPILPLKRALEPVKNNFDFILIDSAPALNLTNAAVIGASDKIILPVSPDRFSEMGLDQTMKELDQIEADFNLKVARTIILTKVDGRENTSEKYSQIVRDRYPKNFSTTAIRVSSDVKNAISMNQDLFQMGRSNAKEDYDRLTVELMGLKRFLPDEL
jgi:chromosome partitioning protein